MKEGGRKEESTIVKSLIKREKERERKRERGRRGEGVHLPA